MCLLLLLGYWVGVDRDVVDADLFCRSVLRIDRQPFQCVEGRVLPVDDFSKDGVLAV